MQREVKNWTQDAFNFFKTTSSYGDGLRLRAHLDSTLSKQKQTQLKAQARILYGITAGCLGSIITPILGGKNLYSSSSSLINLVS